VTTAEEAELSASATAATKSVVLIIAVQSIASGAPNLLWGLTNVLHMIAFFPLQNIVAPEFVNEFCSSLLGFDFMPIIYPYVFSEKDYTVG
jgi:hypothetical protein